MKYRIPTAKKEAAMLATLGSMLDVKLNLQGNLDVRTFLMRAILTINDKKGERVPFVPNPAQQQIAEKWGRKNIILKARQMGISTYVAARFFIDTITRPGTLTVQVAHDQRAAEDLFRIVHRFQENLPASWQEGVLKTSRANVRQLRWPLLDSEYRVESAADRNAGRGMTIRNLHCSEVAMWSRDGAEALVSLRAAVPPDGQVVLESTPMGAGGAFYQEWNEAAETGFVQHFLPWWLEKSYRRELLAPANITPEEEELKREHGLDDEQLAFRREIRANCRGKFAQEYAEDAEECFLLSGDCMFEIEKVEERLRECEMPRPMTNACESRDNGRELIWLPPQPKHEYILAVDPAGGGSNGDYTCAQVIDRVSGMQCAELHAHLTPRETAPRIMRLGHEYNDALLVIERNNHGEALWENVRDQYDNTYENWLKKPNGWVTSVANRPGMIAHFGNMLATDVGMFSSARLLRECRTFLRQPDGGSAAANGAHDDTVLAMAIAQMVRKETAGRMFRGHAQRDGGRTPSSAANVQFSTDLQASTDVGCCRQLPHYVVPDLTPGWT
jgi:hypothetical protein